MPERFDDAPRWYWAVSNGLRDPHPTNAGDRVVIACGKAEFWSRVRREVESERRCAWMPLGDRDGVVTLADCFKVLMTLREQYGANLNRVLIELSQIPVFAQFILGAKTNLCNLISNPMNDSPLYREPYDRLAESRLGDMVEQTLGITDDAWRGS